MLLEFKKAFRKSVPMLISISSVSGGGKTYSALKLAAGLAGPKGRVGFIDTENGRGSMYADSPGIVEALPNGYEIMQLDPPFSPVRYIAAIEAAEKSGMNVLVIDSVTHEWEGIGGCCEIAETNKLRGMPNWSMAKMAHKRFMNHCLSTDMHLIFCIRARDKVKIIEVEKNGKKASEIVPIGIQPIAEKNFVFEMLVSLQLDEKTHHATPIKVPEPLAHLFPTGKLLTQADGEHIRQWNQTGVALESHEQLTKRSRAAAEDGMGAYKAFFAALTLAQRKALDSVHSENKATAERVDREAPAEIPEVSKLPDAIEQVIGTVLRCGGATWSVVDSDDGQRWLQGPVLGGAA